MASNFESVAGDQLQAIIDRVERLEEEIKGLNDGKKEVYAEARGNGFDVDVIKKIVRIRKMDHNERMEQEALLELYMAAIGMAAAPDMSDFEEAPRARAREEVVYQAPRVASLGDQKQAYREGKPISQDFQFENATVYAFVFHDLGRVKIGISNDVEGRLKAIEKQVRSSGNLFYSRPGNRKAEMAMHERFSEWRLEGEWFRYCDEFIQAFTEYAEQVGAE